MSEPENQHLGEKWGEFPPSERQAELKQRLQAWDQEDDHSLLCGPFAGFKLTGADVYWLAAHAAGNGDIAAGNISLQDRRKQFITTDWTFTKSQSVDLRGAHLQSANLFNAQLHSADLYQAQLQNANLGRAQLPISDLREAKLQGANLEASNLWGCDLRGARFDAETNLDSLALDEHTLVADVVWDGVRLLQEDWDQVYRLGKRSRARQ
jgi:uncharacterized protein YjbI with pentapeptide repeats